MLWILPFKIAMNEQLEPWVWDSLLTATSRTDFVHLETFLLFSIVSRIRQLKSAKNLTHHLRGMHQHKNPLTVSIRSENFATIRLGFPEPSILNKWSQYFQVKVTHANLILYDDKVMITLRKNLISGSFPEYCCHKNEIIKWFNHYIVIQCSNEWIT